MGSRSQCHRIDAGRLLLCLFLHPNAFKKHTFFQGKMTALMRFHSGSSPQPPVLHSTPGCARVARAGTTRRTHLKAPVALLNPREPNWSTGTCFGKNNIVQFVMPVRMTNKCLKHFEAISNPFSHFSVSEQKQPIQ